MIDGNPRSRRILIVTGEASGDMHGAGLIEAARATDPGLSFFGVGGPRMREAGCDILIPAEELAVMGLVEACGHLPRLWRAFRRLKQVVGGPAPPDLVVLIDFAEFNLRLARVAKRAGVPILYYISPQVWAWRRGRIRTIADRVDGLAVIFPFEPDFYRGLNIDVQYVGHPLLDDPPPAADRSEFLGAHGLDPSQPVVGLFPGSRPNEIRYILRTILDAADLIRLKKPEVQYLLPVAPTLNREKIQQMLVERGVPVALSKGSLSATALACDAVITVSGTATLETALSGIPMVIVYKMASFSYLLARWLVDVPYIGLVNIVAGKRIVPELVQGQATPDTISRELLKILEDPNYADKMRSELSRIRERMGEPGCSKRVVRMVSALSRRRASNPIGEED